jgi:hypothetical protein
MASPSLRSVNGSFAGAVQLGCFTTQRTFQTCRLFTLTFSLFLKLTDCLGFHPHFVHDKNSDIERGQELCVAPFGVSPVQLSELTIPGREMENVSVLLRLGSGPGIVSKLLTDAQNGISGSVEDLQMRRSAFGENRFSEPPFDSKSFNSSASASVYVMTPPQPSVVCALCVKNLHRVFLRCFFSSSSIVFAPDRLDSPLFRLFQRSYPHRSSRSGGCFTGHQHPRSPIIGMSRRALYDDLVANFLPFRSATITS